MELIKDKIYHASEEKSSYIFKAGLQTELDSYIDLYNKVYYFKLYNFHGLSSSSAIREATPEEEALFILSEAEKTYTEPKELTYELY